MDSNIFDTIKIDFSVEEKKKIFAALKCLAQLLEKSHR